MQFKNLQEEDLEKQINKSDKEIIEDLQKELETKQNNLTSIEED